MNLTSRQLAFLEHELTKIAEADDRRGEDVAHATSVLDAVESEIDQRAVCDGGTR